MTCIGGEGQVRSSGFCRSNRKKLVPGPGDRSARVLPGSEWGKGELGVICL